MPACTVAMLAALSIVLLTTSKPVKAQSSLTQPFALRDQNLFNLIHGQALPTDAELHVQGVSSWSSSLTITNTTNIQRNSDENIYLDYEAWRFNLSYQYGLAADWNLKLSLPLLYQGGGMFDSAIDNWHQFFGLPRGQRTQVVDNQYRVQYDQRQQTRIALDDSSTALGDLQLAIARALLEDTDTSLSLWAGLKLPTGDADRLAGSGAADLSAWLALNRRLTPDWSLNVNAGVVVPGQGDYKGMALSAQVLYGHAMLGWSLNEEVKLKLQLQGHSRYYEDSRLDILGDSLLATFGGTISISSCQQLDIAFSEDIKVSSSPDISLLINWRSYAPSC